MGAAPCWIDSLGHAFAYSAWLGLDEKKFPIEAEHRQAELWMITALLVQTIGVLFLGKFWSKRYPLWPIYLGLVPASFLPTLLLIAFLAHR